MSDLAERMKEAAMSNRASIRKALTDHPGITLGEVSEMLGMSRSTLTRHVAVIRSEWASDEARKVE